MQRRLHLFETRNAWQQRALGMLGLGVLILIVLTAALALRKPVVQTLVSDEFGRLLPVYPVHEPVLGRAEVTNFAGRCVTEGHTFSFVHYRRDLERAANCFTPEGWSAFSTEISRNDQRLLSRVVRDNLIATANLSGAAVVTQEGLLAGRYTWLIQVPMVVTLEREGRRSTQHWLAEVQVVRVPQVQARDGIAIHSVVTTQLSGVQ